MYRRANGVKNYAETTEEVQAFFDIINKQIAPKTGYICLNIITDDVRKTMEAALKAKDGSSVIKCEIQGDYPAVKLVRNSLQFGDIAFFDNKENQFAEEAKEDEEAKAAAAEKAAAEAKAEARLKESIAANKRKKAEDEKKAAAEKQALIYAAEAKEEARKAEKTEEAAEKTEEAPPEPVVKKKKRKKRIT